MHAEGSNNDIMEQYRSISNKLRKRYFRKPNITEASKSFSSLSLHCDMNELLAYSGMCWIAAARCEGSLGNSPSETNYLVRAARQFIKTETKDDALGYPSLGKENLQAALSCYGYAANRCSESSPLTVGFNLEIANVLKKLDMNENGQQYLKLAIAQTSNSIDVRLHCLNLLASCYVNTGDYTSALAIFSEMYNLLDGISPSGTQIDIILRCELSRVFLLLILRPTPQRLAPALAKLLEKYMWADINDSTIRVVGMSEQLFILLQSLVMACQSFDTTALPEIEADLWPHLSTELRCLLRNLVHQYNI